MNSITAVKAVIDMIEQTAAVQGAAPDDAPTEPGGGK